jgi:hypothetical protein
MLSLSGRISDDSPAAGSFLEALHEIPVNEDIPTTLARLPTEMGGHHRKLKKIYPLLLKHRVEWVLPLQ